MKAFTTLLFLLLGSLSISAQDIYFRIGGSYGLPASGEDYGLYSIDAGNESLQRVIYGSNGAELTSILEVGYRFQDYLSFQLGLEFLSGDEQTKLFQQETLGLNAEVTEQSQQIRIIPALVISPKLVKSILT